jgi:multidrug efflux pump subunit AcrA (membrane-fusion protein)
MRSLNGICLVVFAAVVALVMLGCGHKASQAHESGEGEPGVTFNAKKGLLIPPTTAKFIGLLVADVEERKIAAEFKFSAQVYRAASEAQIASLQASGTPSALASGNISPADAAKVSEGQTVSVQSGDDGVALPGRIVTLKRGLEKSSGQIEVLLAIADTSRPLPSGAFVSVTVPLGGEKRVVSVPRSSLFRTTEGDFVYTVSGDHFMRAPIKLGVVNHEFAEVTDGLYAGDQVVVQPVMALWMAELQSLRGGKACADGQ